jgi:hypothetical protein
VSLHIKTPEQQYIGTLRGILAHIVANSGDFVLSHLDVHVIVRLVEVRFCMLREASQHATLYCLAYLAPYPWLRLDQERQGKLRPVA